MARTTKVKATEQAAEFTFTPRVSERVIKREGSAGPNPLRETVRLAAESGETFEVPVKTAEQAKQATNYLRYAAAEIKRGLAVKTVTEGNEIVVVFKVKDTRKQRKYTADDIRTWAKDQGYEDKFLTPKLHADVRTAYRRAHGYEKVDGE